MARLFPLAEARRLALPGRISLEIVSGERGAERVSFRLVEIAPTAPGEALRGPHVHDCFEECIHVLEGEGVTEADSGAYPLKEGDTLLVPAGERHVTRNVGTVPLKLLCFFPTADVATGTTEFAAWDTERRAS